MRKIVPKASIVVASLVAGLFLGMRCGENKIDQNSNAAVVESTLANASERSPAHEHGKNIDNAKVFYVITERHGSADTIRRLPITGEDTVIDALAEANSLTQLSSPRVWIVRPAPPPFDCEQILPVDYEAIVKGGSTATNYQLMAGDRVFVVQDNMGAPDMFIGMVKASVEALLGLTSLPLNTVHTAETLGRDYYRIRNSF